MVVLPAMDSCIINNCDTMQQLCIECQAHMIITHLTPCVLPNVSLNYCRFM